jgi:hypothetical protein
MGTIIAILEISLNKQSPPPPPVSLHTRSVMYPKNILDGILHNPCRVLIVQRNSLKFLGWTGPRDKLDCFVEELKITDSLPCLHTCILVGESGISAQKLDLYATVFEVKMEYDKCKGVNRHYKFWLF